MANKSLLCSSVFVLMLLLGMTYATTITSYATGDWSVPSTWNPSQVPTSTDTVIIANGHKVTIDVYNATCSQLTIQNGGILEYGSYEPKRCSVPGSIVIDAGGRFKTADVDTVKRHRLVVHGNIINNGILDFSTSNNNAGARICIRGTDDVVFTGTGDTTDLSRLGLWIYKDDGVWTPWTCILELSPANLTCMGVSTGPCPPFIGLYFGTLKISGTFAMTCSLYGTIANPTSNPYYMGSGLSSLWLNNPNFTIGALNASATFYRLRITQGTFNVGTAVGNNLIADATTGSNQQFIMEGGMLNIAGRFGMSYSSGTTSIFTQTGGTINVATVGNNSSAASFGITATNNLFTMSGGQIIIHQRSSYSTPLDYNVATTNINISGGTLQLGSDATTSNFDFYIRGALPNLVIDNTTYNKNAYLRAAATAYGDILINNGTILDLNGYALTLLKNITNNGTLRATTTGSSIIFQGTTAQTLSGDISNNQICNVTIYNGSGATIIPKVQINNGLTLTYGTLTGNDTIWLGTGTAGTFTYTKGDGSIAADTIIYKYSGMTTINYTYSGTSAQITGNEMPSTISGTLTINNSAGVTLNESKNVGKLVLSAGILNTGGNLLTVTGQSPGDVTRTGGYVYGPLARTLPANQSGTSTWLFPVGKSDYQLFEIIDPTTSSAGTITVQVEVFDDNCGGSAGTGLSSINTNRYWSALISGAGSLISTKVRLTETGLSLANAIGQSATQTGAYNNIGATWVDPTLLSEPITSLGYFVIGTKGLLLGGTYTVGTGEDYTNLNAVAAELKAKAISGNVNFSLTSNYSSATETYPITFNPFGTVGGNWRVNIKPAPNVPRPVLEAPVSGAIIELSGIDNLTLDSFVISNTNASATSYAIRFIGGASSNIIKNCLLKGANTSTGTSGGVVLFSSAETPSGKGNNDNVIDNCEITASSGGSPTYGISSYGSSPMYTRTNNNNTIKNCKIYDFSRYGVYIGAYDSNATIIGNEIYSTTAQNTTIFQGIRISATSICNTKIIGNKIYNLLTSGTSPEITGIYISMADPDGPPLVANNFIALDATTTHDGARIYGIRHLRMETQTDYYSFFNNSIYIGGTATTGSSYGFYKRNSPTQNTQTDFRNNIIFNTRSGGTANYCIYDSLGGAGFISDYNDLFVSTPGQNGQYVGYRAGANLPTLNDWKNASGQDAHSISIKPDFVSENDLHILSTSNSVNRKATPISGITTDIDGELRNEIWPDIGADEYTPDTTGEVTLISPTNNAVGQSRYARLRWNKVPNAEYYDVYLDNVFPPVEKVSSFQSDTGYNCSLLDANTKYYWQIVAWNDTGPAEASSSSASDSFTTRTEVVLSMPNNGTFINDNSPILIWQAVFGAETYRVQIDTVSDAFNNLVIDATTNNSFYEVSDIYPLPEKTCYWRVRVETPEPADPYSETWSFTVDITPPEPPDTASFSIPNGAVLDDPTPTFEWGAVSDAVAYNLLVETGKEVVFDETLNVNTYTPEEPMADGDYTWMVKSRDMAGNWGVYSPVRTFTIQTISPPIPGWAQLEPMPTNVAGKYVKDGGALTAAPEEKIYALYAFRGNKSKEFKKYTMGNPGVWAELETIPFGLKYPVTDSSRYNKKTPGKGAALCWDGATAIYATKGNGTFELWKYDLDSAHWYFESWIPSTKGAKGGTSIFFKGGLLYVLVGGQKLEYENFFAYNSNEKSWTTLQRAPGGTTGKLWKDGSSIVAIGETIFGLKGSDKYNSFWAYDIASNNWTEVESCPQNHPSLGKKNKVGDGGAMTTDGSVAYMIKGKDKQDFWMYNPTTNAWTPLDTIPRLHKKSVPKTGAALAYANGRVYLLKGNKTPEFWQYGPHKALASSEIKPTTNSQVMTENSITNLNFSFTVNPNPFNRFTTIRYTVPVSGKVSIKLYNAEGRLIKNLLDEYQNLGYYILKMDGEYLTSGVYFLRYQDTRNHQQVKIIVR
ncbi:MAG: T9SS type A sorting domain-containing protein [candidate division WOR-3 bacterium]